MKINFLRYSKILLWTVLAGLFSCNEPITDFGFDGKITGIVTDNNGNPVSGDRKLATYSVHALGEFDKVPMVMRILGEGDYANTMLYPQSYKVTLRGPFIGSPTDTIVVDLTGGNIVAHNFTVTPLLTIPPPSISGNPTANEVNISYSITGNSGNIPNLREVYVSTVSWPTRTTGSGMGYQSVNLAVTADTGTATITGLQPDTRYFVRVGARAAGQSLFNHSEQIVFTTPAN
jgi:hypothetical protein